jgi:hypothetical protein
MNCAPTRLLARGPDPRQQARRGAIHSARLSAMRHHIHRVERE